MEQATKEAVKRVLSGDVEAYADIVRAHQKEVWRVTAYALADREATCDLVQQVFVEAYLHLERYDPEREFGAWIRTIARNRLRNELRRQTREKRWLTRYREVLEQRLQDQEAADQAEQALAELRKEWERLAGRQQALVRHGQQAGGHPPRRRALDRRRAEPANGQAFMLAPRRLPRSLASRIHHRVSPIVGNRRRLARPARQKVQRRVWDARDALHDPLYGD